MGMSERIATTWNTSLKTWTHHHRVSTDHRTGFGTSGGREGESRRCPCCPGPSTAQSQPWSAMVTSRARASDIRVE
eukprot:1270976-Rhodomonas_salina.2